MLSHQSCWDTCQTWPLYSLFSSKTKTRPKFHILGHLWMDSNGDWWITPCIGPIIDGILPKGPYPPCLRMADRALLAGYPRYVDSDFCEARRASHCHSPQTTYSSKSTCCAISAQNSAMHVVVYAGRLTSQRLIVEIINGYWSYWQISYPVVFLPTKNSLRTL